MKTILLFGAGKSSTVLIHYLLQNAAIEKWKIIVVDADISLAREKIEGSPYAEAISFNIEDSKNRNSFINKSDIVISLLPPSLHFIVAKDCVLFKKNLLTASYIDDQFQTLKEDVEKNNLLFLCEMGLDPGIDHMSAKKMIDEIHNIGGKITSFHSHCGGLIAPSDDDNPWHYKISWNPKNVVMAGKNGAIFKKDNEIIELEYPELFAEKRYVNIPGHEQLCWYPNRNSLSYISKYGLDEIQTFIRTTLRHPDFIYGWKNIIDLKLTDDVEKYDTNGITLAQWFSQHLDRNEFSEWLQNKLHEQFDNTKSLLTELVTLVKLEEEAAKKGVTPVDEFMMIDEKGDLQEIDIDDLKINAAATLADRMHDANLTLKQLFFLGMNDEETLINKGSCSALEVLQFVLETKLALQPHDKDMVVMMHQIEYEKDESKFISTSSMVLKGQDATQTAMAKTVGLPLGIAAKLILNGTIQLKGLHIPISKEIYEPVLKELHNEGISFKENVQPVN